jgi:3-hydroxyisobutyrate dehydrogenase-like beta-hydroxyacid dehydrogenase
MTAPTKKAAAAVAAVEFTPGAVVFFDAPVFGGVPAAYVGVVIAAAGGRVRVHTLGLAADAAAFTADQLRDRA